ncbi:MAG: hypothetical protein KF861_03730 [Planctomycetaceae bacterium]|nr:hypothetical protein [Planctomycetaceae bacterium]
MVQPPRYTQGYAVIRVDNHECPGHVEEYESGGTTWPAPGPGNITIKEVVFDAGEAQNEVLRLNNRNSRKACRYYWQTTHVFLDGGSHGSAPLAIR